MSLTDIGQVLVDRPDAGQALGPGDLLEGPAARLRLVAKSALASLEKRTGRPAAPPQPQHDYRDTPAPEEKKAHRETVAGGAAGRAAVCSSGAAGGAENTGLTGRTARDCYTLYLRTVVRRCRLENLPSREVGDFLTGPRTRPTARRCTLYSVQFRVARASGAVIT